MEYASRRQGDFSAGWRESPGAPLAWKSPSRQVVPGAGLSEGGARGSSGYPLERFAAGEAMLGFRHFRA